MLKKHLKKVVLSNLTELTFPSYQVVVDYGRAVEQLVGDGEYDWCNTDIVSRNFPSMMGTEIRAQIDIYLVSFDRRISSEGVITEMEILGLRPATIVELLALGAQHPDIQRDYQIAALGSTWSFDSGDLDLDVPYLGGSGSDRYLFLFWWGSGWSPYWRFAAVRK